LASVSAKKTKCAVCAVGFFSSNVDVKHDFRITYNGLVYEK
jgi:hypothetical protein